jgi:site-specific DNA-adenine methylase
MQRKFFFSYVGGKTKDMSLINQHVKLDGIKTLCEPFCGSCSFSIHHDGLEKYMLSDNDPMLIEFLRLVKQGEFDKFVEYFNAEYPRYVENRKLWYDLQRKKDMSVKEWYFIRAARRGGCGILEARIKQIKKDVFTNVIEFFMRKNVSLVNSDYLDIFEQVRDDPTCFVFLDPPYLDSFNSSYSSYQGGSIATGDNIINDRMKVFIDIMKFLRRCKCKVLFIINKNSITEYLYGDFIKGEYEKRYNITGRKTKHLVIANYD